MSLPEDDDDDLRYAQGQGQEYTMAFRINYWRPGMAAFKEYRDSVGRNVRILSIN